MQKMIFGGVFICKSYFILYLEENHTLFREKLYFIWQFSSGNTVVAVLRLCPVHTNFFIVDEKLGVKIGFNASTFTPIKNLAFYLTICLR